MSRKLWNKQPNKKTIAMILIVCMLALFVPPTPATSGLVIGAGFVGPVVAPVPPQVGLGLAAVYFVVTGAKYAAEKYLAKDQDQNQSPGNDNNKGGNDKSKGDSGGSSDIFGADYAIPLSTIIKFVGDDKKLQAIEKVIKPLKGYTDVIIHGYPEGFGILLKGKWYLVTPEKLAEFIRTAGYKGGPIRLLSCSSGQLLNGAAQKLSNELGAKIIAPTDTLWIFRNGAMTIGKHPLVSTGYWRTFEPLIKGGIAK